MDKKQLLEMGVSEEHATAIAKQWADGLKGFVPKERFDEVNEAKKESDKIVKERDKQLETLKKSSGDVDALKAEITKLQGENKQKQDAHEKAMHQVKVDAAVEKALQQAHAVNAKAVRPFLEGLDAAEFNDDGTVKGLGEQLRKLVQSDDTKFLFSDGKPVLKGVTPAPSVDPKQTDATKMTYSEIAARMAQDPTFKP